MAADTYPLMNAPEAPKSSMPSHEDQARPWCKFCKNPTVEVRNGRNWMSLCCDSEYWRDFDHMMLDRLEKAEERLNRTRLGDYDLPTPAEMERIEAALEWKEQS